MKRAITILFFLLAMHHNLPAKTAYDDNTSASLSKEEKKWRLLYRVFLYDADPKNALKVAQKALRAYPDSVFWHEKAAQSAQWSGETNEALRHYLYLYTHAGRTALRPTLLKYALSTYRYEIAVRLLSDEVASHPTRKKVLQLARLYEKTGEPEKALRLLKRIAFEKKPIDSVLAAKALRLALELGALREATAVASKIDTLPSYDLATAQALRQYYLMRKEPNKAYDALAKVDIDTLTDSATAYYRSLADTGEYLGRDDTARKASEALYKSGRAERNDYERLLRYYRDTDPDKAIAIARDAFARYRTRGFFALYTELLYKKGDYDTLIETLQRYDRWVRDTDPDYYPSLLSLLAQSYLKLKRPEAALRTYRELLRLHPGDAQTEAAYLWSVLDMHRTDAMRRILRDYQRRHKLSPVVALPLAAIASYLQSYDTALRILMRMPGRFRNDPQWMLTYAYLKQAQHDNDAFLQTMRRLYVRYRKELRHRPSLLHDRAFLDTYLKTAFYFLPPDRFDALLRQSKAVLDETHYRELLFMRSMERGETERLRYLSRRYRTVSPWIEMALALAEEERARQAILLDRYRDREVIPVSDAVEAARRTGRIREAQSMLFRAMNRSRDDATLAALAEEIYMPDANRFDTSVRLLHYKELSRWETTFSTRIRVGDGWRLEGRFQTASDRSRDKTVIENLPAHDNSVRIALQKRYLQGAIALFVGMRSAMRSRLEAGIDLRYDPTSSVTLESTLETGVRADETLYLLVGGQKDRFRAALTYRLLDSQTLYAAFEGMRFYGQDDAYLGYGYRFRGEWYRSIRNGYPDLAFSLFVEYGNYSQKGTIRSTITDLSPYDDTRYLPETYFNAGATLAYGISATQRHLHRWRPYLSLSPYYDGLNDGLGFSCEGGIGASIVDGDRFDIGFTYDRTVSGNTYGSTSVFIRYRYLF